MPKSEWVLAKLETADDAGATGTRFAAKPDL